MAKLTSDTRSNSSQPAPSSTLARQSPGSDHYKWIALSNTTIGMLMATINSSIILISMPAIFTGNRGVSSGMRATFMNAASLMSIGIFFSIVTAGLAQALPSSLFTGLTHAGLPTQIATGVSHLPPTAALFAAFLGYNPLGALLPPAVLAQLPVANQLSLLSKQFFPGLIAEPFMVGMHGVFIFSTVLCLCAAVASGFCQDRVATRRIRVNATLPVLESQSPSIDVDASATAASRDV